MGERGDVHWKLLPLDGGGFCGRLFRRPGYRIPLLPGVSRSTDTRQTPCDCVLTLVVDGEQILTANRTGDGSMYGITSTDATLVKLGLEYWESPRCCAA